MEFFKANGIQESQVTVRFHGERYPLAPNTNNANRAKNRRVAVRLERGAPVEQVAPQATKAATSATS
jgi:flagellar motor protein MotB